MFSKLTESSHVIVQNVAVSTRKPIIAYHPLDSTEDVIQRPLIIAMVRHRVLKFVQLLLGFLDSILVAAASEPGCLDVIQIVADLFEHTRAPLVAAIIIVPVPVIAVIVAGRLGLHANA